MCSLQNLCRRNTGIRGVRKNEKIVVKNKIVVKKGKGNQLNKRKADKDARGNRKIQRRAGENQN